ncbi:hypothetical protein QTO34_018162 [Cnephaeus nilssonii]|uniref:C2H2-type domain-containing protein n=1 Tax=Cnephaeus nilssonii TaxID=3371016 RepID=A0AA40HYC0_CNENI|nr:hypothetical protein QTO34_018162 [Eptesicus nilssonii]
MPEGCSGHPLLIKEADKLMLGQNINIKVPDSIITLMDASGQHWLTHAGWPSIKGSYVKTHNQPDLTDKTLRNPDLILYTDRSSFMNEGRRYAGYAIVLDFETLETKTLCYAFATLHIHGAIYKERGLLTAGGKGIKNQNNQNEILKLLEVVWEPKEIAVIHCKEHQKGKDLVSEGNPWADTAAKQASREQRTPSKIMLAPELPIPPKYTAQEEGWALQEGGNMTKEGWWILPECKSTCLEQLAHRVVLQQHELTHLGKTALEAFLSWGRGLPHMHGEGKRSNQNSTKRHHPKIWNAINYGFRQWPAFMAEVVEQSSGKVEHMNQTIKQAMAKLCQEITCHVLTYCLWLSCGYIAPQSKDSPIWGTSPTNQTQGDIKELGNLEIQKQLQGLGKTILKLHRWVTERIPIYLGITVHPHKPGDQIRVKDWKKKPIKPTWKGPYLVILTTPTALKVAGLNTWIHHSRVKVAHPPKANQPEWKITPKQGNPLQITLNKTVKPADGPTQKPKDSVSGLSGHCHHLLG